MHSLLWFLDKGKKEVAEPFNNFFKNIEENTCGIAATCLVDSSNKKNYIFMRISSNQLKCFVDKEKCFVDKEKFHTCVLFIVPESRSS